ncbi:beta-glucuronidase [Trueperella pecoris]|uniref:Beta-glucuronidase n=1 Tax=Trueperella pecoris TaxID=2733571 RepID=A0A7M1QU22_9ACTO|nr:beta-glucuronidase [Trueperella pecoris]QOR44865.1 beta-glucuronidase [Trueperella pecoris]
MLRVRESRSRQVKSLNGRWDFKVDTHNVGFDEKWYAAPLDTERKMAVPGSYNDVFIDTATHDHVGYVWYQTTAFAPSFERLVLHFGSATHAAVVFVNGAEVVRHEGGYLPFEADISEHVQAGEEFTITVAVDNRLSWQTIPPGYVDQDCEGNDVQHYFHDFYNYAGIHRTVSLYTRPAVHIQDVTIVTDIDGADGVVAYDVVADGATEVKVRVVDSSGREVANAEGASGKVRVPDADFWAPGHGALYTLEVTADEDVYPQRFGIRTVSIEDGVFKINGEPFYFRGYGRHEDNIIRGKQHDDVSMINDFDIMRWQGANSFRTSHYPYAEDVMDYADEQGWVVIDETPAVGLNTGLSGGVFQSKSFTTFSEDTVNGETQRAHAREIRDLIARDKNHPSVVIWSIANEPETNTDASRAYFEPLVEVARAADSTRPVGYVNVMLSPPHLERITDLFDVIMLNRYYGWYVNTGKINDAEAALRAEIDGWLERFPGKPIIFTEYGPDTLNGNKDFFARPWSEEYQAENIAMFHRVFDDYPQIQGEQMWNFADFQTTPGIMRVGGNKKGMFTRDRQPKLNAYKVRERWLRLKEEQGR